MPVESIQRQDASTATEHWMTLPDGQEIFYRVWAPGNPSNLSNTAAPVEKALLLIHRGHEHSGSWIELAEHFRSQGYWIFAPDLRGHGRSPGERGFAERFSVMVRDIDRFVDHLVQTHSVVLQDLAVVAHSIGAVVAAAWVHDYAPPVRAMVLATPALRVKLYVPLAVPGLRLLQKVKRNAFIKSYVRPQMLTHDEAMAKQHADDELTSRNVAVNMLLGMHDVSTRLMTDAATIRTPTLILSAGSDWVVKESPQRKFFDALGSTTKEYQSYQGFYHSIFHEKDRARPIAATSEFLAKVFNEPVDVPSQLDADQQGSTKTEYDALQKPLSPISPKGLYYGATRAVLKTAGQLSGGVRLGWQTGFNSGESLDYIYRNRTSGVTPLGWLIDRVYLSSPGWTGIRQRKVHLQQFLEEAIGRTSDAGNPVQLLDVAAGPGRYALEVLAKLPDRNISALLCDQNEVALAAGRKLAAEMGLKDIEYRRSDAFDAEALAALRPRPNVVIVSGLFELFADNSPVKESLRGLGAAVEDGGFLIYTNQPWHPQLELIARGLCGMDGKPWVMRCRTQAEMDQLVAAAGFEKIDMLTDDEGIFTVSLARRRAES